MRLQEIKNKIGELRGALRALLEPAAASSRMLSEEETAKANGFQAELERAVATLKYEEQAIEWDRNPEQRPAAAAPPAGAEVNPWGDVREDRPLSRSAAFGAFLQAVAEVAKVGKVDPRLMAPAGAQAAASGLNTTVPSEGGFLVRHDFNTMLLESAMQESQLAGLCTTINIGADADGVELPYIDETSRANGSRWGGVQVFRRAEADTVAASKPKFGTLEIRLEDLMGICYATDRMQKDAISLGQIIQQSFASEMGFTLDDEVLNGTGVGQCVGIIPSAACVSQAAEGSQTAATVVAENVVKMRSRIHAKSRGNMVWLINAEVEPQLPFMVVKVKNVAGTENVGGAPIYMPASGLSADGYDRLFGRPVIPVEQCAALGTPGDILGVNLKQYLLIQKGGIESVSSIHVRFLYNENTFRFTYRVNGAPAWKTVLSPYKGTLTVSPFVKLAAR